MPPSERSRATLAILDEASARVAHVTCDASTECCRFGITGREPWVTQAEWEVVMAEVARQGRKLPAIPDDDTCPFLSAEGRCRVYAGRPLGCRTFFCERARSVDGGPLHHLPHRTRELADLPRKLDALTVPERGRDTGARTLRSWLREALDVKGGRGTPKARAARRR